MREINERISRNVSIFMGRDRINQTELARRMGCHPAQISRAFKGVRDWSIEDLYVLARVFEIEPTLLLEETDHIVRSKWSSVPMLVPA